MRAHRFLTLPLIFLLGATPGAVEPVVRSPLTESYETVKLGTGLYAFIAPTTYGGIVTGNTLLVVGDSAALVVDAGHFPTLTRRMIADIRRNGVPWKTVEEALGRPPYEP